MLRLVLGAAKGAIVGGAVGYGAYRLGLAGGWGYVVQGAAGLAVGLLVGRPFWSHLFDAKSTLWTSILKGLFGFGLGVGLFALVRQLSLPELSLMGETRGLSDWPFLVAGAVGLVYGAWVEVDDPPVRKPDKLDVAPKS